MNILHVSSTKSWRGGEQQIAYLVEGVAQKGGKQWVFCVADSKMESYCLKKKINHFTYQKKSSFSLSTAKQIKQICVKNSIDIIHTHDSHGLTFTVLAASVFSNKPAVIVSRRVDFPIGQNIFSKWKYNHPSIEKILTVSGFIKNLIAPKIKNQEKIEVVYDGIDKKRFLYENSGILHRAYEIDSDVKLIGNVAAIAPHKDYYTFVKTAEEFLKTTNQKVLFFIIGADDGEQEGIEQLIVEKNLQDKIILTGFRNDIPKILPELDIFLFTSKEEGLGTSILDAFACGVPVVATRAGGIPETVIHQETGLIAEVGDVEQLAKNIKLVLSNKTLAENLIKNAKSFVNQFSIEKMVTNTYKVYEDVLKNTYL